MKVNSFQELQHYMPGVGTPGEAPAGHSTDSERPTFRSRFENLLPGQLATSQLSQAENIRQETAEDPERKRLYDAAVEFQAVFLNMMLKSMRATLNKDQDLLHGGRTQEIFEDMLYDEYSKVLSRNQRFGLAEQIYQQFSSPPSGAIPEQAQTDSPGSINQSLERARADARSGYAREMIPLK